MSSDFILCGKPVKILSFDKPEKCLDVEGTKTFSLVPIEDQKTVARYFLQRLDGPNEGNVLSDHRVALFIYTGGNRIDIGEYFGHAVGVTEENTETSQFIIVPSSDEIKKIDRPLTYGEHFELHTVDGKYKFAAYKLVTVVAHKSWATELMFRSAEKSPAPPAPTPPAPTPPAPTPPAPTPPAPTPPAPGPSDDDKAGATLESILVAVYEGVKRAQVHVQRGLERKMHWYFPVDANGNATARTVKIPVPKADGTIEEQKIPLFALAPHHDVMLDELTVRMRIDLMNIKPSIKNQEVNEIESRLATRENGKEMYADIEIKLKGTEPTEGVARLNDSIVKRI